METLIAGLIVGFIFGVIAEDSFDIIHFKNKIRE